MNTEPEMLCAKCEKPLEKVHGTAYQSCCGEGYLTNLSPQTPDRWFTTLKKKGMYWYRNWVR